MSKALPLMSTKLMALHGPYSLGAHFPGPPVSHLGCSERPSRWPSARLRDSRVLSVTHTGPGGHWLTPSHYTLGGCRHWAPGKGCWGSETLTWPVWLLQQHLQVFTDPIFTSFLGVKFTRVYENFLKPQGDLCCLETPSSPRTGYY